MSMCYFMCDGYILKYNSSFFHEISCSYCYDRHQYRRIYQTYGFGHKNGVNDLNNCKQCDKNRREEEKRYERKNDDNNNSRPYSYNKDFVDCGCLGEEEKQEKEEEYIIF